PLSGFSLQLGNNLACVRRSDSETVHPRVELQVIANPRGPGPFEETLPIIFRSDRRRQSESLAVHSLFFGPVRRPRKNQDSRLSPLRTERFANLSTLFKRCDSETVEALYLPKRPRDEGRAMSISVRLHHGKNRLGRNLIVDRFVGTKDGIGGNDRFRAAESVGEGMSERSGRSVEA